jgi:hypothetical protein
MKAERHTWEAKYVISMEKSCGWHLILAPNFLGLLFDPEDGDSKFLRYVGQICGSEV